MKKLSLLLISLFLFACNNEASDSEKVEETITIAQTDKLEFLLATAIPIEGGFSIAEQPEHFTISEIQHREQGIFYVYKPEEGFTGTDFVMIKREDSNGAEIYSETITTLTINVTE